ncbi:MAG: hypothetical protein Q9222_003154 [Ikaeria aurantiellina]
MAPSDELKTHTHSTTDFYALLDLKSTFTQQELDSKWRRTALKYHPDKLSSSTTSPAERAAAAEKFHLAQIGYDLLSDPAARAVYDNTRNARLRRERERQVFADGRRKMRDELERREGAFKRAREEEEGEEEKLERELRRLAEDGKRRRVEREEVLRKEMRAEKIDQEGPGFDSPSKGALNGAATTTGVSELDRTVKVRWPLELSSDGEPDTTTATITETQIQTLFSTFGQVETVTMLKPKEVRLGQGKKKRKQLAGTCMVLFSSIVGAHAAVEDFPKHQQREHEKGSKNKEGWTRLDSVSWAANKEPDFLNPSSSTPTTSPSTTPAKTHQQSPNLTAFLNSAGNDNNNDSRPSTPTPKANNHPGQPRKMPSFSSFSFSTPKGSSPFSGGGGRGANSPSLEELTMIRLKNAEKKRLREELVRQDERDAVAAAGENGA